MPRLKLTDIPESHRYKLEEKAAKMSVEYNKPHQVCLNKLISQYENNLKRQQDIKRRYKR